MLMPCIKLYYILYSIYFTSIQWVKSWKTIWKVMLLGLGYGGEITNKPRLRRSSPSVASHSPCSHRFFILYTSTGSSAQPWSTTITPPLPAPLASFTITNIPQYNTDFVQLLARHRRQAEEWLRTPSVWLQRSKTEHRGEGVNQQTDWSIALATKHERRIVQGPSDCNSDCSDSQHSKYLHSTEPRSERPVIHIVYRARGFRNI